MNFLVSYFAGSTVASSSVAMEPSMDSSDDTSTNLSVVDSPFVPKEQEQQTSPCNVDEEVDTEVSDRVPEVQNGEGRSHDGGDDDDPGDDDRDEEENEDDDEDDDKDDKPEEDVPIKDIHVPYSDTDNEDTATESCDDEGDDETYHDYDNDTYQVTIATEQKRVNKRESRSRNKATHSDRALSSLPPPVQKQKVKKGESTEAVKAFCDKHIALMMKDQRTEDYVTALMACTISSKATVWQLWCTPILFCCSILELSLFDWIGTSIGIPMVHIPPKALPDNGWIIPKVPNLAKHMKALLIRAHAKFTQRWTEESDRMIQEYNLQSLPPVLTTAELQRKVNFMRKPMHRLLYSWKDSETRDVRSEILDWMVATLTETTEVKIFEALVEDKVRENMREKMEAAGQTTIPEYYQAKPPKSGRRNGKGKRQTTLLEGKAKPSPSPSPKEIEEKSQHKEEKTSDEKSLAPTENPVAEASAPSKPSAVTPQLPSRETDKPTNNAAPKTLSKPNSSKRHSSFGDRVEPPKKQHTAKLPVKVSEGMAMESLTYAEIDKSNDSGLMVLLQLWKLHCLSMRRLDLIKFAMCGIMKALMGKSIEKIWRHHHESPQEEPVPKEDFQPPQPSKYERGVPVQYSSPGDHFSLVANDIMQIMHVCIVATYVHDVGPPRWFWESNLLNGMRAHGQVTRHIREVAMLVCLILSAATPDEVCIAATIALFADGFLDLHKLRNAKKGEILKCIGRAGIGNQRYEFLKKLAAVIIDEHNGSVPCVLEHLLKFDGVGRKTAVLAMNEIFGLTVGIGVDTHVIEMSQALGFIVPPNGIQLSQDHVERSLLKWVAVGDCRNYNPIVGSFAQLFVRQLTNMTDKATNERADLVMMAALDHIHKPYHVELLWYAIAKARLHYKSS